MNKYDFIIVGGGPAGAFFAYEMKQKNPKARILLIEQGRRVEYRSCFEAERGKCVKCKPHCNITCGFSGAGAFSDGKLSLYNKYDDDFHVGGNLHKYLGVEETKKLIDYTDSIYLKFGATDKLEGIGNPANVSQIRKRAENAGLELINIPIRHIGTDKAHILFQDFENYLELVGIEMLFDTEVTDLIVGNDNNIIGVKITPNEPIYASNVIMAVGRVGSSWLLEMCNKHKIETEPGIIDIGVRYELKDAVMQEINHYLYEGKFIGRPKPYGDKVRTFCQNPSGFVTTEVYDGGLTLVNGHSLKDLKSANTNLALLVSLNLKNVDDPMAFSKGIAKNMNMLAQGNVLVQRLGDIKQGKRTWQEELVGNDVFPTLQSAVAGDLSMAMPYRVIKDLLGFISQMDQVAPGFANPDNLLYGPEAKFYSNKVKLSKTFETSIKGLYAIGDGCGLTRGLMMASASGVALARALCR